MRSPGHLLAVAGTLLFCLLLSCSAQDAAGLPGEVALIGHWEGQLTSRGAPWSVAADFQIQDGKLTGTADATDLGLYGIPWREIEVDGRDIKLRMHVDRAEISMECEWHGDTLSGRYDDGRTQAEVLLTRRSTKPEFFRTEDLTIEGESGRLSATIIYPNTTGPYVAVVLGHGSGQFTRDVAAYRGRAYLFARSGVAAVMYDRQGKGTSTGDTSRILPVTKLAEDMLALVQAMRSHPDIRPDRIGVYGLSQAGWVVPKAVATSHGEIAFVVTVSAPGITPDSQNVIASGYVEQKAVSKALKAAGLTNDLVRDIIDRHEEARAERLASTETAASESEIVPGFSKYDPIPDWDKITVPVLAVWGENDRLVPAQESHDLIASTLLRAGNEHATTLIFPQATHTLEVDREMAQQWDWNRLAQGFEDTLANWLGQNVLQK